MRRWFLLLASGCVAVPESEAPVVDSMSGVVAPAPCATGCSGSSHAELQRLGDDEIERLWGEVLALPVGDPSLAADTLLFHAVEVQDHLDRSDVPETPHATWLREELARDRVEVGFRLVADDGTVLGWRDDVVTLAEKHHLLLRDTGALGRADINGKVKRVGVKHLWARF